MKQQLFQFLIELVKGKFLSRFISSVSFYSVLLALLFLYGIAIVINGNVHNILLDINGTLYLIFILYGMYSSDIIDEIMMDYVSEESSLNSLIVTVNIMGVNGLFIITWLTYLS